MVPLAVVLDASSQQALGRIQSKLSSNKKHDEGDAGVCFIPTMGKSDDSTCSQLGRNFSTYVHGISVHRPAYFGQTTQHSGRD